MFKIILSLMLSIILANPSWAYLTAGKIAVTATSSSAGVSSTSVDSDISDIVGTSVSSGVVFSAPQICLNNVCETAWPSGGSQTSGNNLLFGNGSGGFTNVSGTSTNGSFITIAANTINSTGINWTSVYSYGTSTSSWTQSANLKIAYGIGTSYNATITNLPFTTASTYSCMITPAGNSYNTEVAAAGQTSGSQMTLAGQSGVSYNWLCIGY